MVNMPCRTPAMYIPSDFVLADAQLCAKLVNTAYDQFTQWVKQNYPAQSKFQWTPNGPSDLAYSSALWGDAKVLGFNNFEPFGFIAWDGNGNAYISYRGTMTTADEVNDAAVAQTPYTLVSTPDFGNVHSGFSGIYNSLSSSTRAALGDANNAATLAMIFFTGHSMGAALCTLAIPDVIYNFAAKRSISPQFLLYNFASPRVGDTRFACSMNTELTQRARVYRIVNTEDIVPTLPPAASDTSAFYEHIGTQISFTAQYLSIDGNHSMADSYTFAINNPNQPQGPLTARQNAVTGRGVGRTLVREAVIPAQ
jgi:predicted lipase